MKFFEDDMDELFNKAGRQYPLKTDLKDWESVRAALHAEDQPLPAASPSKKYRRLLPLLLLLLLIPAVYVFLDKDNVKVNDGKNNEDVSTNAIANDGKSNEQVYPRVKVNGEKNSKKVIAKDKITETTPAYTNTKRSENRDAQFTPNQKPDNSEAQMKRKDVVNTAVQGKKWSRSVNGTFAQENRNDLSGLKTADLHAQQYAKTNTIEDNKPGTPAAWTTIPAIAAGYSTDDPASKISLNKVFSPDQPKGSASIPNRDKRTSNRKGFYYGIIAAPDLSSIKGQPVKKMGYSAGVIAGFNVNAHWAFEAGMLWSNKKYYTDGKYLDKKGPGIPDYVNVNWLDGGCNMFEFPLVVRYNLTTKRNTFYANAGLTSYMMRKEDYNYGATAGVSGNYYEGYRSYNRSGDHLFANLQLGAGYIFGISPKINVRVEPYLKTPLKKIGIGKMPITSTGLYFAITRDLR